ncbi:MAG: hypothetical protein PHH54_02395 [Candidatus Nanoarchaeia archaeon]|nr:hypothetical protein [Candidatus Nanoarchaeia archaeon]MDD5740811.1 hypothetical protein [Candidatus Nanoarchaeia archaeon]
MYRKLVYRKYVYRNGKRFGPYYCESYRDKDGKVRTRFVSGPKKSDSILGRIKKPRYLLITSIIITVFLLLLIGNINYNKNQITGKAVETIGLNEEVSFTSSFAEKDIAEKIANNEIKSNMDLTKNVDVNIKRSVLGNKIMEFDTPEGRISLEFDLLNYSEWYEKETQNEIEVENFDININESAEKYKWGYNVKLNDLSFMAKINVKANKEIEIIDNQTLKIGRSYISFADLSKQNFTVNINKPVILNEINISTNITSNLTEINITTNTINITETNITTNTINITETNITALNLTNVTELNIAEINVTISENITEINITTSEENATEEIIENNETIEENITGKGEIEGDETRAEEPINEIKTEEQEENTEVIVEEASGKENIEVTPAEEIPTITSSVIKPTTGFIFRGILGIGKFIVSGVRGITGLIIEEQNVVTVYVQKDFTNSSYKTEDIINLDPTLIIIEISKAEHLDGNKDFISDIYPQIQALDGNWSETVNNDEYVRVTFEQNLTNKNDITIYARATDEENAEIEVYKQGDSNLITKFENISNENWYKVYLINLSEGESYNVFDLKILGSAEFDYIVDPTGCIDDPGFLVGGYDCTKILTETACLDQINCDWTGGCIVLEGGTPSCSDFQSQSTCEGNNQSVVCTWQDTDVPVVTILAPANNSNFNTSSLIFNASGSEALSWCGLSISGAANQTMTLNSSLTGANYTNSSIADGSYTFIVSCNDTAGNTGSASEINILVDTLFPQINFTSPTPSSGSTQFANAISVNVSLLDLNNISTFIDLDNSLASWWRMDDVNQTGLGAKVYDYTGRNNGTAYNNTYQVDNGKIGKAFSFDGNGDYINTENNSNLDMRTNSFSFGAWIKISDRGQAKGILSTWDGGGSSDNYRLVVYESTSAGGEIDKVTANVYDGINRYNVRSTTTVTDGNWHFVMAIRNSSSLSIFVDGKIEGSRSLPSSVDILNSADFMIGKASVGGLYFNGTIDDVMIFNRDLSIGEVQGLYANASLKYLANNFTNLARGISHTFKAYTQDIAGNVNETEIRSVMIEGNITACGNLNMTGSTYTLYNNLSTTGDCLVISANNITLNLKGYTIDGDDSGSDQGITVNGCDYTVIGNGTITDFRHAIYLTYSSNNLVDNMIINSNVYGTLLESSLNNVFTDSSFTNSASNEVWLTLSSTNNTFLNVSYTLSKESVQSGSLIRKWYYRAQTKDVGGIGIENASVYIYNGNEETPYISLKTNSTGWTSTANIIESINTGGTIAYYQNSVIAANYNLTLFDDHVYNVTEEQNNLNDSFIMGADITPPVLSGADYSATVSTATINWTTDDPSNSSVTYWASPTTTVGNNIPTISHSVTITGLSLNTIYSYTYTSCDFAGNCNTSPTYTFTTPAEGTTEGSSGGGVSCITNWKCDLWSSCAGGEQIRTCYDDNSCGTSAGKPDETKKCGVDEESKETNLPVIETAGGMCVSDWECDNWTGCQVVYDLEDIVKERTLLKGERERTCNDLNCNGYNKIERQECSTKKLVYAKKIEKCFDNFLEIYSEDNVLISRLNLINGTYQQLKVQMLLDKYEYCPYCFDGLKNYNEDEIDCQYSGIDCPKCMKEVPALRQDYIPIMSVLLILLFLFFLIWYLLLVKKTKKRVKKRK